MQLSEIRYITGLIVQGGGKIAGYSIAAPTGDSLKPDLVLAKDLKQYLTTHNCKIINAQVDANGQVTFRSKADQESYVTMNSSGYILGWPKKSLANLHAGNKTGGKTGEMLRPTHSYLVVDINETEGVVKVMNIGGLVKPMTLGKLVASIKEGLIVSNVEMAGDRVKLLSPGMDELVMGKTTSAPVSSIPPTTISKPAPQSAVQPTTSTAAPLKPPVFGAGANKPLTPPVAPPSASKTVIPPVAPPTVHAKSAVPPTPTVQPKAEPVKPAVSIPPVTKPQVTSTLTFKRMTEDGYDFENNFLAEYAGQKVKIRLDLDDLAPEQFEVLTVNGSNYLVYVTDGTGTNELPYFTRNNGQSLRDFLEIFSCPADREKLKDISLDVYYDNKLITGLDYRMLFKEEGMLNFAYLIDWNKVDLYYLESERPLTATSMSSHVSLLLIPNVELNPEKKTVTHVNKPYGRFIANYENVWYNLMYRCDLEKDARREDLRIMPHPRARFSEMSDNNIHIMLDYPFGHEDLAYNLVLDLTNTALRFIPKNAMKVMHGANYEIKVPASCKRIHEVAIITDIHHVYGNRYSLEDSKPIYEHPVHRSGKTNESLNMANTITFTGSQIERIDKVGNAFGSSKYSHDRELINLSDWSNITVLTETAVAIENLPKSSKAIDVAPYVDDNAVTPYEVNDWYGLGTWSNIGKGKLNVYLNSKPSTITDKINVLIDGTVTKAKLTLVSEHEETGYAWPDIEYLFVEEGVTELEIVACTLKYATKSRGVYRPGYTDNYIKHLILPASLTSLTLKLTHRDHSRFIRNLHIADNSVMSRLDLRTQLQRYAVDPDNIHKYANERQLHDKNMLSDLIGSDLTHVSIVEFDNEAIKRNLALCGINL